MRASSLAPLERGEDAGQKGEEFVELFAIFLARDAIDNEIEAVIAVGQQVDDGRRYCVLLDLIERVEDDERRDHADEEAIRAKQNVE